MIEITELLNGAAEVLKKTRAQLWQLDIDFFKDNSLIEQKKQIDKLMMYPVNESDSNYKALKEYELQFELTIMLIAKKIETRSKTKIVSEQLEQLAKDIQNVNKKYPKEEIKRVLKSEDPFLLDILSQLNLTLSDMPSDFLEDWKISTGKAQHSENIIR